MRSKTERNERRRDGCDGCDGCLRGAGGSMPNGPDTAAASAGSKLPRGAKGTRPKAQPAREGGRAMMSDGRSLTPHARRPRSGPRTGARARGDHAPDPRRRDRLLHDGRRRGPARRGDAPGCRRLAARPRHRDRTPTREMPLGCTRCGCARRPSRASSRRPGKPRRPTAELEALEAEKKLLEVRVKYADSAALDPHRSRIRLVQLYGGGRRVAVIDLFRIGGRSAAPLRRRRCRRA